MKTLKILSLFIAITNFSQCGSLQFDEKPPFKITNAVYENWTGGQPGVQGTNVKINYTTKEDIDFENVYFRNKVTNLQTKKATSGKLVIGYFKTSTKQNEVAIDNNPTKEINNPVPVIQKFPFKLHENDAIISYRINGKLKYYKIKSLKKEKSISFPSAAKQ
ncbi:hypothetical protein [Polaribacter sp.]|uniref:hypothetical protein n=1 Tax=Polaribacter sp. TaxID=1920175 RepID=UPI003F6D5287